MHVEVQVALNFLISFLFNKLPRRRVAQFGEELEATLKAKFAGHWYPEAPSKGSAYRCIKCAPPLERAVFEVAAYQAGMSLLDIEETLPHELTIWVDPGEVSYRLREGCPVKLLYSSRNGGVVNGNIELANGSTGTTTLNPEAQCFRPIIEQQQQHNQHLSGLHHPQQLLHHQHSNHQNGGFLPSPVSPALPSPPLNYLSSTAAAVLPSPVAAKSHQQHPVTFTTAAFAATKFGSTKLKTNGSGGKKNNGNSSSSLSNGNAIGHRNGSPTDFGLFGNHGKAHHQQQNPKRDLNGSNFNSILDGHNWSVNGNGMINHQQQQNNHRQQMNHHQQQQQLHHLRNGGASPNHNNFFAATTPTTPPQQALLNSQTTALDLLDFADLEGCWKVGLSSNNGNNNINNNLTTNIFHQQHSQQDPSASIWSTNSGLMSSGKKMDSGFGNSGNTFENLLLFGDPFEQKSNGQQQQLGLLDNAQLALLSERLWDEIFSISPEENGTVNESGSDVNRLVESNDTSAPEVGTTPTTTRVEVESEVGPLFCSSASSSFSLSSMSSPSLSTTSNESSTSPPSSSCSQQQQQLVNEFDSLSLNSNTSSSVGSSTSYVN